VCPGRDQFAVVPLPQVLAANGTNDLPVCPGRNQFAVVPLPQVLGGGLPCEAGQGDGERLVEWDSAPLVFGLSQGH